MDNEQAYWQMVWQLFKKSLDYAIKCVGVFGIVLGAITAYEHFFSSARSAIPMSIEGLAIWQYGSIILFFGFIGSFIILTIDYFRKKHTRGKDILSRESANVGTKHINEAFNGIQSMDTEHIDHFFEGSSKLNPEQILALFWGNREEQKNGKENREPKQKK